MSDIPRDDGESPGEAPVRRAPVSTRGASRRAPVSTRGSQSRYRRKDTDLASVYERKGIDPKYGLEQSVRSGANWFYWIAGLSAVNSVVARTSGDMAFSIGLGATQIIDAVATVIVLEAPEAEGAVTAVSIVMDLVIIGLCVFVGYQAGKHMKSAFVIGMILYGLDSLIPLAVGDYLSFGFHLFALFCISAGYRALRELGSLPEPVAVEAFD